MSLTAQQATQLLIDNPSAYATEDALRALVNQISVEAQGSITLLYSGSLTTDAAGTQQISMRDLATKLDVGSTDVRIIDNTELGRFLSFDSTSGNQVLRNHLESVWGYNPLQPGNPAFTLLNDAKSGLWAVGSKNFLSETVGEVVTFTANADFNRTFAQTELYTGAMRVRLGILHKDVD